MNPRWLELSAQLFPVAEYDDPEDLEAVIGVEVPFAPGDLASFRACDASTERDLTELLAHRRHRHMVKLLVFASECVPEPLLRPLLLAGVHTRNPSYNKHFVFPCVLVHGRRRVVAELVDIAARGGDTEKAGVGGALYWAVPRAHAYWPHHRRWQPYEGPPDEPVADLLAGFSVWAVRELLGNEDLDVRRALVHHIIAVRDDHPALAQAALAVVRAHPDAYLRERLAYDLGESRLIPCKPHPTATD